MKWKRYLRVELVCNLVVIAVVLAFLLTSFTYSFRNRLFPLIFGIVALLLSLGYTSLYFRKAKKWSDEQVAAYKVDWKPLIVCGVLVIYMLGIYLVGSLIASCLFSGVFVYAWGYQKLSTSLICAGITFFVLYVVFGILMSMPLYEGVLGRFL